jgi:uncharacterized membrane protein
VTRELIELVAQGIEVLAVFVIVMGIAYGIIRYFLNQWKKAADAYMRFRERIGKTLLLGLELLVAADIIRTVALSLTLSNVLLLGLLVVIRTFLSWSLVVEMEGRWPWQRKVDEP